MLQTTESNSEFKIKSYSETPLDDYLNKMSESREEFSQPEVKETEQPPTKEPVEPLSPGSAAPEPVVTESKTPKEVLSSRKFNAKLLATGTDSAFAFFAQIIADDDEPDDWKAKPDEKEIVIEAYLEMMVGYGWSGMPPWLAVFFAVSTTYGPKLVKAYQEKKRFRKQQAELAQAKRAQLLAEKEIARLKDEKGKSESTVEAANPDAKKEITAPSA